MAEQETPQGVSELQSLARRFFTCLRTNRRCCGWFDSGRPACGLTVFRYR